MTSPRNFTARTLATQFGLILAFAGPALILSTPVLISDLNNEVLAAAQQSDGRSIIAGRFMPGKIMRLNEDGTVDARFFQSWTVDGFNHDVLALAVQVDDSVLVGGDFTNFDDALAGHILRLRSDGSLDTAFLNRTGTGFDGTVTAVTLQADGRILVGGSFSSFNGSTVRNIARLNADGSLDESFTPDQGFDSPVLTIKALANGQIFVGGQFSSYRSISTPHLAALQKDGSLESR